MAKLTLNPNPTFKAKVGVPVPGGMADIECVFKYRDKDAAQAWAEASKDASDAEVLIDCLEGWDLDDAFNAESVKLLCKTYPGAAREIVYRYMRELAGIRQGN